MQVSPGSPGEALEPFFDFIVAAAGRPLPEVDASLVEVLEVSAGGLAGATSARVLICKARFFV